MQDDVARFISHPPLPEDDEPKANETPSPPRMWWLLVLHAASALPPGNGGLAQTPPPMTMSSDNMSKSCCTTSSLSDLLCLRLLTCIKLCSVDAENPEPLRQGIEEESRGGNFTSGQSSPSATSKSTSSGPKILAAPKGLVILKVISLKKFAE